MCHNFFNYLRTNGGIEELLRTNEELYLYIDNNIIDIKIEILTLKVWLHNRV